MADQKSNKKRHNNTPTETGETDEQNRQNVEIERAMTKGAGSAGDDKRRPPEMSGPKSGEESRGGQHTDQ